MKICTKCLLPFPITNFYKHKGRKDGHDELCKPCRTLVNTAIRSERKDVWNENRRIKRKTSTHTNDVQRARRQKNKDSINEKLRNNPHRKQWRKENRLKNKEHINEIETKRWAALVPNVPLEKECEKCHLIKPNKDFSPNLRHKDGLRSYCKDCGSKDAVIFHRDHAEGTVATRKKRRAKMKGAKGLERITHIGLAERDHWKCHLCHKKVTRKNWSMDHLIPLSKGGDHTWLNVALAHRLCNIRRNVGRLIPAQLRLIGLVGD